MKIQNLVLKEFNPCFMGVLNLILRNYCNLSPKTPKGATEPHCKQGNLTLKKHLSRSGLKCLDKTSIITFPRH